MVTSQPITLDPDRMAGLRKFRAAASSAESMAQRYPAAASERFYETPPAVLGYVKPVFKNVRGRRPAHSEVCHDSDGLIRNPWETRCRSASSKNILMTRASTAAGIAPSIILASSLSRKPVMIGCP